MRWSICFRVFLLVAFVLAATDARAQRRSAPQKSQAGLQHMTPIEQYNATAPMRWEAAVAWCRNHPLNGLYVPFNGTSIYGNSLLKQLSLQYGIYPNAQLPGSKTVMYDGVQICIGYSVVYFQDGPQGAPPGYYFSVNPVRPDNEVPLPKTFAARNPMVMDQQAVQAGKQMMMSLQGARPPSLPRGALIPQGPTWLVPQPVPPRKPKLQDGLDEEKKPGDATETVVQLVERRQRQIELQEFLKQYELEQRKKEIAARAEPPVEFVAIVADALPREVKTPLEPNREEPSRSKDVGRLDHATSEPAETPALSAAPTSGLPSYAKLGLGILVAALGITGLVVGVWYFGRGLYENLEYR